MEEFDKVEEIEEVEDPPLRNSADFHLRLSARKRKAPSTQHPDYPYMNWPTLANDDLGFTQQTGILELLAIIYCSEAPTT